MKFDGHEFELLVEGEDAKPASILIEKRADGGVGYTMTVVAYISGDQKKRIETCWANAGTDAAPIAFGVKTNATGREHALKKKNQQLEYEIRQVRKQLAEKALRIEPRLE